MEGERREIQRLLELYRERRRLLTTRDPALALVAQCEIGLYDTYMDHFKRKISILEHELEILDAKLGLELYREQWEAMDDFKREGSFLPDQMSDLEDIIEELSRENEMPCSNRM
jgi:hypothetical protein